MGTKVNTKTMLKYEDLTSDVTISAKGVASVNGEVLMKGVTGIYSENAASWDNVVDKATTRIHGNNLELALDNGKKVIIEGYFSNNGKSSFKYIVDKDSNVADLLEEAFIINKNFYNEYNLATNHSVDGTITKTTITGTAFNDTVDLSGFNSNQLVNAKGKDITKLTISTAGGNDTITGSIVNDVITGGAGENTLNVSNSDSFGSDTYKLTKNEDLKIVANASNDDYGNSQIRLDKVGNNIEVTVHSKVDETEEISYQKTVVAEEKTAATKYQMIVTSGDTVATKYTYTTIDANSTAETEGEHQGKYKKVTHTFVRNDNNDAWVEDESAKTTTYEDSAVAGQTARYVKIVNGVAGIESETAPTSFTDEGKFNQTVKVYNRKTDNSGWADDPVSTTPSLVDKAVTGGTAYTKSVNGAEATAYTGRTYTDEGKYHKVSTVFEYEGVRDIAQSDLVTGLKVVDNTHVSKTITTEELSDARKTAGYTVVAGKLHHDATYTDITQNDLKEGLIFVDQTRVKDNAEAEARAITANDFKEGIIWVSGKGKQTAPATNEDLAQSDLANGWTLAENKTDASRILNATTDLTEAAKAYAIDATTGKLVIWTKESTATELSDTGVDASTSYLRFATVQHPEGEDYAWNDNNRPTDMGEQTTGKTIIGENDLGKVVLEGLGKNNALADVKIDGTDLFNAGVINIDGTKGGKITGTIGNDYVTLDNKKAATFVSTANGGIDTFYAKNGANLTYTYSDGKLQELVDADSFIYGDVASKEFSMNKNGNGAYFSNVNVALTDSSKAKYTLSLTNADTSLKARTNNVVYAAAATENAGISVSTNTGNDVVFFGSVANDVVSDVTASTENFNRTKLYDDNGTIKYEKVAHADAKYRNITESDLKDGLVFVDQTTVKDNADAEARAITVNDFKTGTTWVSGKGIQTAAEVAQVLETLTSENATAAINGVAGYSWDAVNGKVIFTTENVNKASYNGGNDAYLGSTGKEEYDITAMNKDTIVSIYDKGGNDIINFTNQNFKDMTLFFDVNNQGKTSDNTDLSIISNKVIDNSKSLLSLFSGKGKGAVVIQDFFAEDKSIINTSAFNPEAKGTGYIEEYKVSGGTSVQTFDAQVAQIAQNVAAWLNNNGNYDSAMDVVDTGNAADIQSLMQCYSAGTTSYGA